MRMNEIQIARILDQARSFVEEEKYLHAYQVYRRLIMAEPAFLAAYLELASLCAERGQLSAGIAVLQEAESRFPGSAEVILRLGNFHLRAEEYDRALTYLKKLALRRLPQVHYAMGIAYFCLNDLKRAEEQFRLTVHIDPAFPRINQSLGELHIRRGAYTEAASVLRRAVESDPYSAACHSLLGHALYCLDDWKKACDEFILAVDMDPGDASAWRMCGESLIALKRLDEAESYLRKALSLAPRSPETLVDLGTVLSRRGDTERALDYIDQALKLDPANHRARQARWKLKAGK